MTDDYIHRRINEILHQKVMMGAGDYDYMMDVAAGDDEMEVMATSGYQGVAGGAGKPLTKKQYAERWMKTHAAPKTLAGVLKNKEFNTAWNALLKRRKEKAPAKKKAPAKRKAPARAAPAAPAAPKQRKAPKRSLWSDLVKKYTKQGYSLQQVSAIYKYMKEGFTEKRAVENVFTS